MKTIKYILFLLSPVLAITGCKEDPIVENPSGETIIYTMAIANGGWDGGTIYNGTVDEAARTVTFDGVAAETDIERLRFGGKISLGAKFEQESYDFYNPADPAAEVLNGTVKIISGNNASEYRIIIHLAAPESDPMVSKIEVETASGRIVSGKVDVTEKFIYLNVPGEERVTIKSIVLLPARASCVFTKATDNVISKNDAGMVEVEFWGKTDSYTLLFDNEPIAGINFGAPIVHDFSVNSNVWSDFAGINTRSADMDGEHILLVSRQGGNIPKLLNVNDILANNAPAQTNLSVNGMVGGTYVISSGRLMQGHIYICNLTTGLADTDAGKLKLYHYATPTADPQLILDYNGIVNETTKYAGRYGDNMSLDLDEAGNGYVYFANHGDGARGMLRFTVTDFTTINEPVYYADVDAAYYAFCNKAGTENAYVLTNASSSPLHLVDKDMKVLTTVTKFGDANHGDDAHIINYNSGRYLIMTSGRQQTSWSFPTLYIYDITEGLSTVAALLNFNNTTPEPVYTYKLGEATASACVGITAWAAINGKLCVMTASPNNGFALIEFPKNQQ